MVPEVITEEEIAKFLAKPKFMDEVLDWKKDSDRAAIMWAAAPLKNETGATISEHMVDLTYRRGRFKDECKYMFTIYRLVPQRTRLYQIEVVPPHQKSYMVGGKSFYGPHQHFGSRHAPLENPNNLGCAHHKEWFELFCKLANIGFSGKYTPPVLIEDLFR
jgi:hypothetical protein